MDFITEKHIEKIKNQTNKTKTCWLWTGYKDKNGYGIMNMKSVNRKVHRVVYFLNFGEIPAFMFVCHKCDNPSCINPKHLFLGTPNDNVQDMMKKGRYVQGGRPNPGEKNGRAQISEIEAIYIIKKLAGKINQKEIAKKYGVSRSCIQKLMTGKSWKHLGISAAGKRSNLREVSYINENGYVLKNFKTAVDADRYFGFREGTVWRACKRNHKTSGKIFIFR